MTITAERPDVLETVIATLGCDDLLHALVGEMDAIYPANADQNGRLDLLVSPTSVDVRHPEWVYKDQPGSVTTGGTSLSGVLASMLRAVHTGRLVPADIDSIPLDAQELLR